VNASRRRGWVKAGDDEAVGDRLREEPGRRSRGDCLARWPVRGSWAAGGWLGRIGWGVFLLPLL